MNSVKLQDTKLIYRQLLHFYTLIINYQNTIPFIIAPKRIKYLGINLNKEVKDLNLESYKTSIKESTDDTNKSKDIPGS